jgi:branched-chain amino acid transport system substrate-binding protein
MRVKFAYAVSAPAAVEMLTACSEKSDGEVGRGATSAATGHAAPLMGRIAYPGKHNENGARLAVENINTEGQASGGTRIQLAPDAQRPASGDDAAAYDSRFADRLAKPARATGATIVIREATNDEAADIRAILTTINSVQPDVSRSGGVDTTGGSRAKQAATFGIRAKILGGDGVCTDKVGELAGSAMHNPVCSEAEVVLSAMAPGVDFGQQTEDRSHTPVQIDAPFTYDVLCVIVDAMKRANSFDAPKVLAAMPSTGYNGVTGHIAIDHKGDLKEGAITLYDFRDSEAAVLDAVEM